MKMQGNAMEIIAKMAGICWPTEGGVGKDSECTEGVWEEWQCPGMMSKCPEKLVTHGSSAKQPLNVIFSSGMVRGSW